MEDYFLDLKNELIHFSGLKKNDSSINLLNV